MAELRDAALLIRRVAYGDSSLICHFLTAGQGRIALMARGARRPKSSFRASLEPLYSLQIGYRSGRTGMGTLTDVQRGASLLPERQALDGLEVLAIASRLFQEGDPNGYDETIRSLEALARLQDRRGLPAAVWQMFEDAGWLGDLSHCWQCGAVVAGVMRWHHAQLLCDGCACSAGLTVSAGLRRSVAGVLSGGNIQLSDRDSDSWYEMLRLVMREHGVKPTDSFKG